MAEEQKPVPVETPAAEQTPVPAETPAVEATTTEPAVETAAEPTAEPTTEATETAAETTAPAEEKVTKTEKPVEPIYFGTLGYKAPGGLKSLIFSKKYFWFGDEAVSSQNLSSYLRGEKPEIAHPTVAWSTQTGKGLLYFVKHESTKATPAGVLNLSEASDVTKDGTVAFYFKLHGHKHTFETSTSAERNGWFMAVEKAVEEAKAAREEILASEGYKAELEKLGPKPATLAVAGAAATPKKSTEVKPAEPATARAGSSSSDENKKSKGKSRSVSRGKRGSLFGNVFGKKEEKAEEKKEEKAEDKKEDAAAPEAEASTAPEVPAPAVEEAKAAEIAPETTAEAGPATETTETTTKPKPAKRGSIFGFSFDKFKSPTSEKESEAVPPVPAKDEASETPAEAPKAEETTAPVDGAAEASKAETPAPTATTPHKEKEHFSFGKFLGKEKAKSPTTEASPTAPVAEEAPKIEETPAPVEATETAEEAPKEEEAKEETPASTSATPAATPKTKRNSVFSRAGGLLRQVSKAGKGKEPKKEKDATVPTKVEETAEPAATEEGKETEPTPAVESTPAPVATEPASIGDVVPDAVTVGQAPKSNPEVAATA